MRMTALLRQKAGRNLKSLAISVHFRHPDFGMTKHEILCRATAFLLSVDPPEPPLDQGGRYDFLKKSQAEKEARILKQRYAYKPVGGPPREIEELGWLEFCPTKFRPEVHCVAASHVLAPWNWNKYYPQDWLNEVKREHCTYSLEVFDRDRPGEALAKFALNPYPIHDPDGRDLAIIHLKDEETVLKQLKKLGVQALHLRAADKGLSNGDQVTFDGFEVKEMPTTDDGSPDASNVPNETDDDIRVFVAYEAKGEVIFTSPNRILASTATPLPEGLCGGPALDEDGDVCGIVEGYVPLDHPNEPIRGAASFLPSPRITQFLDVAERMMLEQIMPKRLFDKVVDAKMGEEITVDMPSEIGDKDKDVDFAEIFDDLIKSLKKHHTKREIDAVVATINRERDEVIEIMKSEGGDVDEVIARVRSKTLQVKEMILQEQSEQGSLDSGDEPSQAFVDTEVVEKKDKS